MLDGAGGWCSPRCRHMRKIVVHAAGSYDRRRLEEHPDPIPAAGEILVDVQAAGVNYADCVVRMGLYESAKKYVGWPITPGFEVAGTVAALGEGVTDLALGTRVFGVTRFGGYAVRVVVPRHQVFPLPERLTLEQAAGFPAVFMTAYYALYELLRLRTGMTVLVHSAAGGVGGALLQLGKTAGCRMVGVVGAPHKVDTAKRLGADAVIDKSRESLWAAARRLAPEGYDVILDANGVETLRQSYEHLAPAGKLVVYGSTQCSRGRVAGPTMPSSRSTSCARRASARSTSATTTRACSPSTSRTYSKRRRSCARAWGGSWAGSRRGASRRRR